jgi:dihydrofolate reductase
MTIVSLVAAVARDGAIGRGNDLLFRFPADQKRFRAVTLGHPVIMGRRTWESLPARFRPLPGRRNIVVTRTPGFAAEGAETVASLDQALAMTRDAAKTCIIGGSQIFAAALPLADELLMTEVDALVEADTWFPPYRDDFVETARESHVGDDGLRYDFVTYHRRTP